MTTWQFSLDNNLLVALAMVAFVFMVHVQARLNRDKTSPLHTNPETDHPITAALKQFGRMMCWLVTLVTAFWVVDLLRATGWTPFSLADLWAWVKIAAGWAMVEFVLSILLHKVVLPKRRQRKQEQERERPPQFHTRAETAQDAEPVLRDLYELQRRYGGKITVHPIYEDDDDDGQCGPHTSSITRGPWLV